MVGSLQKKKTFKLWIMMENNKSCQQIKMNSKYSPPKISGLKNDLLIFDIKNAQNWNPDDSVNRDPLNAGDKERKRQWVSKQMVMETSPGIISIIRRFWWRRNTSIIVIIIKKENTMRTLHTHTHIHMYIKTVLCMLNSEPINFTNYTDGQLTPNFTLYAVDDIFKFAAFSSSQFFSFFLSLSPPNMWLCYFYTQTQAQAHTTHISSSAFMGCGASFHFTISSTFHWWTV